MAGFSSFLRVSFFTSAFLGFSSTLSTIASSVPLEVEVFIIAFAFEACRRLRRLLGFAGYNRLLIEIL